MFAVHIVINRKRVVLHMGLTDDINRRAYKHRDGSFLTISTHLYASRDERVVSFC